MGRVIEEEGLLSLGGVGDGEFSDGCSVAPEAHEALLAGVAEGVVVVGAVEGVVGEGVEELPGGVEVHGVGGCGVDEAAGGEVVGDEGW